MVDGKVAFGPQRPSEQEAWNFDAIKSPQHEGGDVSGTLMQSVEAVEGGGFVTAADVDVDDDDNASTTAMQDDEATSPFMEYHDAGDEELSGWDQSGGQTTPEFPTPSPYYDDHSYYESGRGNQDADLDTLHLENTGMTGDYDGSPPPLCFDPATPPGGYQHDKTD